MARFRQTQEVTAAADGTAAVTFQPPGNVDYVIQVSTIRVIPPSPTSTTQPSATDYVNGIQVGTTSSGGQDTNPQRTLIRSGDVYEIRWTGCDSGSACTATILGVQYPYGTAPAE